MNVAAVAAANTPEAATAVPARETAAPTTSAARSRPVFFSSSSSSGPPTAARVLSVLPSRYCRPSSFPLAVLPRVAVWRRRNDAPLRDAISHTLFLTGGFPSRSAAFPNSSYQRSRRVVAACDNAHTDTMRRASMHVARESNETRRQTHTRTHRMVLSPTASLPRRLCIARERKREGGRQAVMLLATRYRTAHPSRRRRPPFQHRTLI